MRIQAATLAILLAVSACGETKAPVKINEVAVIEENAARLLDTRRVLDLEGGVNFRDLGGYQTTDGQQVKWRAVFRSGSPAGLTPGDIAKLEKMGVRTVCDFRSNEEREAEPNPLIGANPEVEYLTRDYRNDADSGDLGKILLGPDASPEKTRQVITAMYKTIPEQFADSYRAMFQALADGKTPLAFNCSAGKDRAGVGAALILSLLGVPRPTIVADYALSDKIVDYRAQLAGSTASQPQYAALAKLPWTTVEPLLASDPAYIENALASLTEKYGSMDAFIETKLGVTPAMRDRIRAHLLEPSR